MKRISASLVILVGAFSVGAARPVTHPGAVRPVTSESASRPQTAQGAVRPTSQVSVNHPQTTVSVTHPQTEVAVTHGQTSISALHPQTTVEVLHPQTTVEVFHPQTTVAVVHPQTEPASAAPDTNLTAGAKGGEPAASTSSQAATSMSDFQPKQAKDFTAPTPPKAAPMGGGSLALGNDTADQAAKDAMASQSIRTGAPALEVDPTKAPSNLEGLGKRISDRAKFQERRGK